MPVSRRWLAAAGLCALLGCSSASSGVGEPIPIPSPLRQAQDFEEWVAAFRSDALAQGISAKTFDNAFAGVKLSSKVIEADRRQPEFERQIWTYLDGAVSEQRVRNGRALLTQNKPLLDDIGAKYGVDASYLVAIWGIESSYGAVMGDIDVIASLATLAFEGRRADWGRRELLSALTIIEKGYADRPQLIGSWAGAMGQTQFMPSAYLQYAVDYDGDGKRDVWSNLGDVFASTANYLAQAKWRRGEEWGREVAMPAGFDLSLASESVVKPGREWRALGLSPVDSGGALDADRNGSLLLPGGYTGPAFLVYPNYRTILAYNSSTAYALAVGHLGDRLEGAPPIAGTWPVSEPPLARSEREDLQRMLALLGYDPGKTDGIVGANTRAAIRLYQQHIGVPADGFPTQALIARLRADTQGR